MIHSERSLEGYLLIDHQASPGIPEDVAQEIKRRTGGDFDTNRLREGQRLEAPTWTCGHCSSVWMVNPLRTRDHTKCFGCLRKLCDNCGLAYKLSRTCRPISKLLDMVCNGEIPTLLGEN